MFHAIKFSDMVRLFKKKKDLYLFLNAKRRPQITGISINNLLFCIKFLRPIFNVIWCGIYPYKPLVMYYFQFI